MKIEKVTKKEYKGIDIMKFLLAIVVIASHTNLFINISNPIIINAKSYIFALVVPYFFIASGFFIGTKILKNKENTNIILKNKIKGTLKLYILWTIIYLPITIYEYITNGEGIIHNMLSFIRGGILIGEHFDSWPLWYLLSMIYSLIFIYILLNKVKKKKVKTMIVLSTFIIAQIITYMIDNLNNLSGIFYYIAKILSVTVFSGRLLNGIIFIYIGMKLPKIKNKIFMKLENEKNIILKIIAIIIFGIIFGFSNNFVRPFIILVVEPILFSLSLNINCEKLETVFFRKASTVMYFMHMIFYFIYSVVIHNTIKYDGFESFIFVLICTLTLSIIVYKIEKKVI